MRNGFDDELQDQFPEGKVFSNAIFSLSIIEFCEANDYMNSEYSRIVDENINRILSNSALQSFNSAMTPKYGMFYNGWCQLVLTKYQNSKLFEWSNMQSRIIEESTVIRQRLLDEQKAETRILDTYVGANWPADNLIGLISIDDESVRQRWLEALFTAAEHESGLIHHEGSEKTVIRGSSQAMITYCLSQMKYENIEDYNEKYKGLLIDNYLGVQLVKENENGSNYMDVDSGPVVFGYGASGTIMNIKTQASVNSGESKMTWAAMNVISLPVNAFGMKFYLFKKQPMFDIFMLWGSVELK